MPGGGGGAIQDMITSLKNNKNLLKSRRNFRELNSKYADIHYEHNKLELKKPSKQASLRYKRKLEDYKKRNRLIDLIGIVAFIVIIALGIYIMRK